MEVGNDIIGIRRIVMNIGNNDVGVRNVTMDTSVCIYLELFLSVKS